MSGGAEETYAYDFKIFRIGTCKSVEKCCLAPVQILRIPFEFTFMKNFWICCGCMQVIDQEIEQIITLTSPGRWMSNYQIQQEK